MTKLFFMGIVRFLAVCATGAFVVAGPCFGQFLKPTPQELSMTELTGYPGVPAVVLYYEQVSKDDLHVIQRYERIKVLSEEGKKYANVQLDYVRTDGNAFGQDEGNEKTITDIQGRTIHPDGTIIPFTGKPYLKTIEEIKGIKRQARVFTLPDVEVGSIVEYRYAERYNDHMAESPDWYIQRELYVKSARYAWYPTGKELVDEKSRPINSISWFPILPAGAKIEHKVLPTGSTYLPNQEAYVLDVTDVPPTLKEEYMPPLASYSYRVYFNFTAYRTGDEYWKSEGKEWSKKRDGFMKESGEIKAAAAQATAGETTAEGRLRRIYEKIEAMENTDYTRERTRHEDGQINNVTDVLKRGRGSSTQLTQLFVAMARAAGVQSYVMLVPNRSENFFTPLWLSFSQFDDLIAIANVDGKDVYLDPGWRYTPYGRLAWQHTFVGGLRQLDGGGSAIGQTPGDGYTANRVTRVANLKMDEHGQITGKIDMTYFGAPALQWRHSALRGDPAELRDDLRQAMEKILPSSLEVKVEAIDHIDEYEQPFAVSFSVVGTLGTPTGKRLVMPIDLFESRSSATFSKEKRELAVDFSYAESLQDALRINFPKGFEVEALPKGDKYAIPKLASYQITTESDGKSFTTRRTRLLGEYLFLPKEYADLRTFYSQIETKDKESVVLKLVPAETAAALGN